MLNLAFDVRIKDTAKVKQAMLSFSIPFTGKTLRFTLQFYKSPETWARGISARCKDGRYVVFLDYDKMEQKQVEDEITYLQAHFLLGDAFIFECDRDGSYHAIIPDKLPLSKVYDVLKESSVEWAYRESVKLVRGHEWVLRTSGKGKRNKPVFLRLIPSLHNSRVKSTAHMEYMSRYYNTPRIKYVAEDNITEIAEIDYTTGNRTD